MSPHSVFLAEFYAKFDGFNRRCLVKRKSWVAWKDVPIKARKVGKSKKLATHIRVQVTCMFGEKYQFDLYYLSEGAKVARGRGKKLASLEEAHSYALEKLPS